MTEADYELRERECIMEFDGGLTTEEARRKAIDALKKPRNAEQAGNLIGKESK